MIFRTKIFFPIFLMAFLGIRIVGAEEKPFIFSRLTPRQGEAVLVSFKEIPSSVKFDGRELQIFSYRNLPRTVFGLPADKKPGAYIFEATINGQKIEYKIVVRRRSVPVISLSLPPSLGLTPKALTLKLAEEKNNIAKHTDSPQREILFSKPFGLPLRDNRKLTSVYGEIRKTGDASIRHLGIDLASSEGAGVGAVNAGVIRSVYTDAVYGKSIILEHGGDIFSLYFHLKDIYVQNGQMVSRGALIGSVGSTGYATSPHLHLSIKVSGVSIDPLQFIKLF